MKHNWFSVSIRPVFTAFRNCASEQMLACFFHSATASLTRGTLMRVLLLKRRFVAGEVSWSVSHFAIAVRSYVWPSDVITASTSKALVMGQVKRSGSIKGISIYQDDERSEQTNDEGADLAAELMEFRRVE